MHPSLTHIALHVANLDACVLFYEKYCQLKVVHERSRHDHRILWLAEEGREDRFVLVMLSGGPAREQQKPQDFSHLGFALDSRAAVDVVADQARLEGCLIWEPIEEPFPVGYYCGLKDPEGHFIEFSYGQPLGPGAPDLGPKYALASDGID